MASLREVQARIAAAIRGRPAQLADEITDDGIAVDEKLRIYANNARAAFEGALESTYPVLRRRVGAEYFRQLAHHYRERHASRSGDLLWVGRDFPAFVAETEAGTGYEWLADLAALEWAREIALHSGWEAALDVQSLAGIPDESIAGTRLSLQPSLACLSSNFPVLDVWSANQGDSQGESIDLARGAQQVLVACGPEGLLMRAVERGTFDFVCALRAGSTLGEAVATSGLSLESLPAALGLLFANGLVTGIAAAAPEEHA